MQVQAAAVLALLCCLVERAAAGRCGADGPEVALSELNEGCTSSKKSRSDECVSAMHQFCQKVTYGQTKMHKDTLGVSQKHESGKIFVSCIKSEWSGLVSIAELQKYEKECTVKQGGQSWQCLAATHRFCKDTLGADSGAGIIQKVNDLFDIFYVQCFKSPHKRHILHKVLSSKKYHSSCESDKSGPFHDYRSHTDDCFAAASKWCQDNLENNFSGGITQEVDSKGVTVACYEEEFSNWVHIEPGPEFYTDKNTVAEVCDLKFDTKSGKVLNPVPQLLQTEFYDNRGSPRVPLHNTFTVSKEVTQRSSFTRSNSYTISGSATTNLQVQLPKVTAGGSITVSESFTQVRSLTEEEVTKTTYSKSSNVEVLPGEAVTVKAIAYIGNAEVPWSATVINGLGHNTTISDKWRGVQAYNLKIEQVEGILIDEVCSCPMSLEKEIAELLSFVVRK